MTRPVPPSRAAGPRRIAYLSYSSGEHDARSLRLARSATARGDTVVLYTRWFPGLPPTEDLHGFRLRRVPVDWRCALPVVGGRFRRRAFARMAADARAGHSDGSASALAGSAGAGRRTDWAAPIEVRPAAGSPPVANDRPRPPAVTPWRRAFRLPARLARRVARRVLEPPRRWRRLVVAFPLEPMGWAVALERIAEPADLWHGMWAGSLPALGRLRRRHGGRTIYDSRDVYLQSRDFARLGPPLRSILASLERRWARSADAVVTVNEAYADLLVEQLGISRPVVVLNCPEAWTPPWPDPDHLRTALGLAPGTDVVLYQGQFLPDRGIEQSMEAILEVDGAVLVLMGYGGKWGRRLAADAGTPPWFGRVQVLPSVPPDRLLEWSAGADVMVMAIQPTTPNHRFTTPQKLFEALAAGVPVVASDLPGMAEVVRDAGCGELCDPTDPAAIAAAIRTILGRPPEERQRLRAHILEVAHDRYHWAAQARIVERLYDGLVPPRAAVGEVGGATAADAAARG